MPQHVTEPILAGELMPPPCPPAPETWPGIVAAFEQAHRDAVKRLERTTDADFHGTVRMAGGKVPSIYGPSGDEPWW